MLFAASSCLGWFSNRVETRKNVVNTSFWIAFSRGWVHILPVSISIFLIQLNVRGYYIGPHLRGPTSNDQEDGVALAFIQVAAKILELLIVASFASVIFQVIRDGSLHDDGIPFGIATSRFSFDRMQYFWSPALWGGLWGSCKSSKFRGMLLLCILAPGGLIALVAGPASAALLLPRITTWQLFETPAWLNGTNDHFWPENLTSDHIGVDQCDWSPGMHCVNKLVPYVLAYYSISQNGAGYQISLPEQKYPRIIEGSAGEAGVSAEAWSVAPHAATSFLLNSLLYDSQWNGKPTGIVSGAIFSKAAAVRTVCSRDMKSFDRNTPSIPLPLLSEHSTWAPDNDTEGPYVNVSFPRSRWKTNMMANPETVTTVWIPPGVNMTSMTVGIVIFGQQIVNSSQRNGVVCSIDARWNRAKHVSSNSGWYGLSNQGKVISAQLSSQHTPESTINGPLPIKSEENWSHISAEIEWLNTLSYSVPANTGNSSETEWMNTPGYGVFANGGSAYSAEVIRVNTTYLGNVILTQARPNNIGATPWDTQHTTTIETVISTVMADAISRIGSAHLWSTPYIPVDFARNCSYNATSGSHPLCPPPLLNDNEMIQLTFNGSLTGYAYKASTPTDYFFIAVLSIYVFIALAHTIRLLVTRRSSLCWDPFKEFVLLAETSDSCTEGTSLKNTSAGVSLSSIMALRTLISSRAADESKNGQEELQLLVEKDVLRDDGTNDEAVGEFSSNQNTKPSDNAPRSGRIVVRRNVDQNARGHSRDVRVLDGEEICLVNRLKGVVEEATRESWDWWPLGPRLRSLEPGKTRVLWNCELGHAHTAEVPIAKVEDLPIALGICSAEEEASPGTLTKTTVVFAESDSGSSSDSTQDYHREPSPSQSSSVTSGSGLSDQPDEDPDSDDGRKSFEKGLKTNKSVAVDIIPPSKMKGYVLFGVQGSKRLRSAKTRLAQIDVEVYKDDDSFFDELVVQYKKLRGYFRWIFSIWAFRTCELIMYHKANPDSIMAGPKELPSATDQDYQFNADRNPPILPSVFNANFYGCNKACVKARLDVLCLFHECSGRNHCGKYRVLDRLPKRRRKWEIDNDDEKDEAWGLHATFGVSFYKVALYHLLILTGPLVFWGFWLRSWPKDWQNASVPFFAVVVLLSLFWLPLTHNASFKEKEKIS